MVAKNCKFKNSILAKLGWNEKDYVDMMCEMSALKIKNNISLTPTETKIYAENVDEYNQNKYLEYKVNCLFYGIENA